MAKRRQPDTIEEAVTLATTFIGIAEVARAIDKSVDMVRKFGDPDKDHAIQLRQALAIDRQLALGGHPQVFAELVAHTAVAQQREAQQLASALDAFSNERPLAQAARVVCEAASLVDKVEQADADGVYSAAEVDALRAQVTALQARLPALKRSLTGQRHRVAARRGGAAR